MLSEVINVPMKHNVMVGSTDEIIPIQVNSVEYTNAGPKVHTNIFDQDEFIRPDTTMEALAKLRTVFKADGTVTGNICPTF